MSSNTTASIYNSNFSKWMPFLGVYIAVATFVCVVAIAIDLVGGLKRRQYWIPSNWSSLSAVSITIIAAASKLSLDISTSMPRQIDQLAKLGTTAFLCIALAIITPSKGKLGKSESLSNIAALSVFVISSVVSMCIQLETGVIFTFQMAHITTIVMICIILVKCVLQSMVLPELKSALSFRYNTEHQKAVSALHDDEHRKHPTNKELKKYLEKFSMMAHSGCPHFLMARLATSVIYTLCGLVAALTYSTVLAACRTHKDKFLGPTSRSGTSNYDWSVVDILIIQTIGVGVGTTVLCIRGSYTVAVQSWQLDLDLIEAQADLVEEKYWIQGSELFGGTQFFSFIEYREGSWLEYLVIYPFYTACYSLQSLLSLVDIILFWVIPEIFWLCILTVMRMLGRLRARPDRCDNPALEELRPYFLQWYTERLRTEMMMNSILQVTNRYLAAAEERKTEHLRELLKDHYSSSSDGFEGVVKFRIPLIPGDYTESPPRVWSISVLTLTWIAIALPDIDRDSMDKLRKSVMQGLVYVKLVEDRFNNKQDFYNFRSGAESLYLNLVRMRRISFCLRWIPYLDVRKIVFGNKTARQTVEFVKEVARVVFMALTSYRIKGFLPHITAGAHYVYGACEMILQDCQNDRDDDDPSVIFDKLRRTISDILGACLINLKYYIQMECENSSSSVEKRREAACRILQLFGETEKIMEILEARRIPEDIPAKEMVFMDNWPQSSISSDTDS